MWIQDKEKKEWIPFDTEHTSKVFWDGEKGWAIKQKDSSVYHVTNEQYERQMLRELDSEAYWKLRQIEDAAKGLSDIETAQVKSLLKAIEKGKKKKEEDE